MKLRERMGEKGQAAAEYMLSISVLAVAIAAAFYTLISDNGSTGPIQKSFDNARGTIESPFP